MFFNNYHEKLMKPQQIKIVGVKEFLSYVSAKSWKTRLGIVTNR